MSDKETVEDLQQRNAELVENLREDCKMIAEQRRKIVQLEYTVSSLEATLKLAKMMLGLK